MPQRHLVVRDALDALAGSAIRLRVARQQGQVCRAFATADRCNEPEMETAEVLSSMLLGCDARPCTYLDVNCTLGPVAGLAAAHGATAECFETYPLWVSSLNNFDSRLKVHHNAVIYDKGAGGALDFDATFHACGIAAPPAPDTHNNWARQPHRPFGCASCCPAAR